MPIRIDYETARRRFEQALELANSDAELPAKWLGVTTKISESPAKTFIPMLGTALLAKASDAKVDPFSLKARDLPRAYTARTLCQEVLVPCAVNARISLGTTGREPLNNQPFFRHERVDLAMVVRESSRPYLEVLCGALTELDRLDSTSSLLALAAFLRVRIAAEQVVVDLPGEGILGVTELAQACLAFLVENPEGGRRGQAFVAACLSLVFPEVVTTRVNDPSRQAPGDVIVYEHGRVILSAEAKQRPASPTEIIQFAARCGEDGISRALVATLDPDQGPLDLIVLRELASRDHGVHLEVAQTAEELLRGALTWTTQPLDEALREFARVMAKQLAELEVSAQGRRAWADIFPE